jgi:hypothetical protein
MRSHGLNHIFHEISLCSSSKIPAGYTAQGVEKFIHALYFRTFSQEQMLSQTLS